jgi:PKD domain
VPFRLNIGICGPVATDGMVVGPTRCQPYLPTVLPTEPDPMEPVTDTTVARPPQPSDVTWAAIRSQFADVVFPALHAKVQPADRTLVNLDTIVYTDENKLTTTTVTLLGFPVIVEATPMTYSWNFGDNTPALTTDSPGAPYPSKEITHKYLRRGAAQVSVTAHYAARYKVADTDWQYVDDTVPITGPATGILIREAVPALVDPAR